MLITPENYMTKGNDSHEKSYNVFTCDILRFI